MPRPRSLVSVERFAAVPAGESAVAEHVDVLANETNGGIGPTEHRPTGMQAAKGTIVPGVGEFGVDRISHILAGIEQRTAGIGIVAAGPGPPIGVLGPSYFAQHERTCSAAGKSSQRAADR